jgi:hypothetical protein
MMFEGDDCAHCSNGLTASKFRESTDDDRATYRKWIRGLVIAYCTLLLVSGVILFVNSGGDGTQVSNLPGNPALASSRPD